MNGGVALGHLKRASAAEQPCDMLAVNPGGRTRVAVLVQGQKFFPVRRMQGPKQWVTQERRRADTGQGSAASTGDSRRRSEPAATDTTLPGIADAVCPGMADGIRMGAGAAPPGGGADLPPTMNVPVASNVVMAYPYGYHSEARVCYGAYVALAHMYGVPSQRGLRDYWRHVYLFRERALAAAQLIEGGPQRSLQASTGAGAALDSQATLMSLTSHQSFTVCGSTATATGSVRRGSGAFAKAHAPPATVTAARASDTIIGPIAVAAGKAFRGSPDSHHSEGDGVRDDCIGDDGGNGAEAPPEDVGVGPPFGSHVNSHVPQIGGDRRSRVQPAREMRQQYMLVDPGGRGAHAAPHRPAAAARSFRPLHADTACSAIRPEHMPQGGTGPGAAPGFHATRDTHRGRAASPRAVFDEGHSGGGPAGHSPAQLRAAVLQFERPRMHVTTKGGVAVVAQSRDAEVESRRRGAPGVLQEDQAARESPRGGGGLSRLATAPVAVWLRDHAGVRGPGVMAEHAAQPEACWSRDSCGVPDGIEWAVPAPDAHRGSAPMAAGAGEGSVVTEIRRAADAGHSGDIGQVRLCCRGSRATWVKVLNLNPRHMHCEVAAFWAHRVACVPLLVVAATANL